MTFRNILCICLGVVLMMGLFSGCAWFSKVYVFEDTAYMKYHYSTGNMMYADVEYTLTYEDGVYTATVKPNGVAEEAATVVTVDDAFVKRAEAMLASYNVQTWDGFKKSDKNVLDGYDFDFYIRNQNGQHISALGYMKWPKNYKEVKQELDTLFGGLLSQEEESA